MKNQKTNFIAYLRVSTVKQAEKGTYKTQINDIINWEKKNNIQVEKMYIDKGKSGWNLDRPEFQKMLEHLEQSNIEGLVIQHNDRFSRSEPIETLMLYKRIFSKEKKIISIMEGELTLDSLEDFLLMSIKTYTSAKRRETDIIKIKSGIRRYKKEKGHWGPHMKRQQFSIKSYKKYKEAGISYNKIANLFNISKPTLINYLKENNLYEKGKDPFGDKRKINPKII